MDVTTATLPDWKPLSTWGMHRVQQHCNLCPRVSIRFSCRVSTLYNHVACMLCLRLPFPETRKAADFCSGFISFVSALPTPKLANALFQIHSLFVVGMNFLFCMNVSIDWAPSLVLDAPITTMLSLLEHRTMHVAQTLVLWSGCHSWVFDSVLPSKLYGLSARTYMAEP